MGNKSMMTNYFKRVDKNGKLFFITKSNSVERNAVSIPVTNEVDSIKLDDVHTYHKPNYYRPLSYNDVDRSKHRTVQFGSKWWELEKNSWHAPAIELEQFSVLVRICCDVVASQKGYVTIKEVKTFLLDHEFAILDSDILSNVVKAFLLDRPHLKRVYSYNRVRPNNNYYGYECDVHYHNSWYDREKWAKILAECDL